MRTSRLTASTLTALLALIAQVPASASATTLPPECAASAGMVTCTYTSGDTVFVVPDDVIAVDVVAVGGAGSGTGGATGGAGARVEATLPVNPGGSLHSVVGGNASGGLGGANGGGSGSGCGGGGGASDIRTSPDPGDRILVAAGGGGAGCPGRVTSNPASPGGSGGEATLPGSGGETLFNDLNYAGLGGGAGCASALDTGCGLGGSGSSSGADGTLGVGGAGGFGSVSNPGGNGGGGGGGLFGGGGGGTGWSSSTCTFLGCVLWVAGAGGGGGGGSNLVPAGGSARIDTTGVPEITISYVLPPVVDVSPTTLGFGSVRVGVESAAQQVTVTADANGGSLHLGVPAIAGMNGSDFRLVSGTCSGATLEPGASCTLEVTFLPAARGVRAATLTIPDDAADSPQSVALTGTGVAPIAQVTPTSIDFGTVEVGTTSGHRTVTVTNVGDTGQDLLLTSETITGPNASDFAFAGDSCITNFIGPSGSCTIDLTFTPSGAGSRSATLTLSDNGLGSPHTVSLTGTGGTPSADLAVSIAASLAKVKGTAAVTYAITVLNAGPSTATGILINDVLSSQTTFVSATAAQGSCVTPATGASGVVSCSFASLASGSSTEIQIVVTVITKKASITNTVTVSATTSDVNLANNTASITTQAK